MTVFQYILLAVVSVFFVLALASMVRGLVTRTWGVLLLVVLGLAGVAVVQPDLTTRVARMVGISSGANLLLYCTVITMVVGFVMVYVRLRRLRREVTLLVRALALRDASGTR